jgi:hypothetical protein
MAVFSMMLVIIVSGMINIVRMHNEALASNQAQDNARSTIDELVRGIRDSSGVDWANTDNAGLNGTTRLCLKSANSSGSEYWVQLTSGVLVLYRHDNGCTTTSGGVAVTDPEVNVQDFKVTPTTSLTAGFPRQEVHISVTVGSSNGTTTGSGAGTTCSGSTGAREFCSVVTLTSGAVPR